MIYHFDTLYNGIVHDVLIFFLWQNTTENNIVFQKQVYFSSVLTIGFIGGRVCFFPQEKKNPLIMSDRSLLGSMPR